MSEMLNSSSPVKSSPVLNSFGSENLRNESSVSSVSSVKVFSASFDRFLNKLKRTTGKGFEDVLEILGDLRDSKNPLAVSLRNFFRRGSTIIDIRA